MVARPFGGSYNRKIRIEDPHIRIQDPPLQYKWCGSYTRGSSNREGPYIHARTVIDLFDLDFFKFSGPLCRS